MTVYETIKSKNIDELAEWFDKYSGCVDQSPWTIWWDKNYCEKCPAEDKRGRVYAWCELNGGKCKYFCDMDEIPDNEQMIKMWLNSES